MTQVAASPTGRKTWVERMAPAPLPRIGQLGLGLAVLTLLCVAITVGALIHRHGTSTMGVLLAAWALVYAASLAWSWWPMRPDSDSPRRYPWAAAACLLQGIVYCGLWLAWALRETTTWQWPEPTSVWLAGSSFIGLFCLGPVLGAFLPHATRGCAWMVGTQVLGALVAFLLISAL